MKNEPKFKLGQTVIISGNFTGKGDLQGNIIECSFNEIDEKHYYLISVNGQQREYVAEKFLSVPGAHQDTNTLDNLQAILKAMNEIAAIDRSDYFNAYLGEVRQRIKEVELLNEMGNLPS